MLKYLIIGVAFNLTCVGMNAFFWWGLGSFTAPLFIGWHLGLIACHAAMYSLTRPHARSIS